MTIDTKLYFFRDLTKVKLINNFTWLIDYISKIVANCIIHPRQTHTRTHARMHTQHQGHPGAEKRASEAGMSGLLGTQLGGTAGKGVITVQGMRAAFSGSLPASPGLGPQPRLGPLFTSPKKAQVRNLEPPLFWFTSRQAEPNK